MTWMSLGQAVAPVIEKAANIMSTNYQPKDDTAQLFKNDKRETDKHPEYEGEFNIKCPHCQAGLGGWIKAWVREAKTGNKYFSIAFKHKQKRGA